MSVSMKEVWVAQERFSDYRRFADEQRRCTGRIAGADRQNMVDRISGMKTRMMSWFTGPIASNRDRRHGGYSATGV